MKHTPDQCRQIAAAYAEGENTASLSERFGGSAMTLLAAVRRGGGVVKPKIKTRPNDESHLIEKARQGVSVTELAKQFRLSHKKLTYWLRKHGIKSQKGFRKYDFNQDYFREIDTEAKATYLGFICADGCVSKKLHKLIIALKHDDRQYLVDFVAAIGGQQPITEKWCSATHFRHHCKTLFNRQARLEISSLRLCQALNNLGVTPKKSLTIKPCPVPENLERHYWRGVVDGDGWVSYREGGRKKAVGLCGSKFMVQGFIDFVSRNTGAEGRIRRLGNIYNVVYQGGRAVPVVGLLYSGATVFLERKMKKARAVIRSERW
jgi:hypothetical protein